MGDYYNTLLTIQYSLFGIVIAGVLVYLQISFSTFSSRIIKFLFRDFFYRFFILISAFVILLTSLASITNSNSGHNFFPEHNFTILTAIVITILTVFLFFLGIYLVFRFSRYLSWEPTFLMLIKEIRIEYIKSFLLTQSPIDLPIKYNLRIIFKETSEKEKRKTELEEKKEKEEIAKLKKSVQSFNSKIKKNYQDPFEPLSGYFEMLLRNEDYATINNAFDKLGPFLASIVEELAKVPDLSSEIILSEKLIALFVNHVIKTFSEIIEVRENPNSQIIIHFIDLQKTLMIKLLDLKNYHSMRTLVEMWKSYADYAITQRTPLFQQIMSRYKEIVNKVFETINWEDREQSELMNDVFRDLGWIFERLVINGNLEKDTIMPNREFTSPTDSIVGLLLGIGEKYSENFPTKYPLIYFDALYVALKKIMPHVNDSTRDKNHYYETVINLSYVYFDFAEEAIKNNNPDGCTLALMGNLDKVYDFAMDNKKTELAEELFGWIYDLAGTIATSKYSNCNLEDPAITVRNFIEKHRYKYPEMVEHERIEILVKRIDSRPVNQELYGYLTGKK